MPDELSFDDLVRLVRNGDQDAAAELVRRYEEPIRRAVRMQLRDSRLRRVWDSVDVCQSVLGNFFARAALGQFELNTPTDLLKLLTTMARNKLATHARRRQVTRREFRELGEGSSGQFPATAAGPTPSREAAGRDLLRAVRERLSTEERCLADQRAAGRPWDELATEMGVSAEALRKRLTRALDRVAGELGLDDEGP
jgi:RNA polymerase sigma-70 factor (ECF subfamily)